MMVGIPSNTFDCASVSAEGIQRTLRRRTGYMGRQVTRCGGQEGVGVVPFEIEDPIIVRLESRALWF